MTAKFKYDIVTLIELIETRPCLWDKFSESFKDRVQKKNAWMEVFEFLEEGYEYLEEREQQRIGEIITTKWQNIRDAFVRSLKKKNGQPMQRNYVYYDKLQFLLKVINKDDAIYIPDLEVIKEENNPVDPLSTLEDTSSISAISRKRPFRQNTDLGEAEILKKPKEGPLPADEHQAFFDSVLPSIRIMTEDEKTEFRVGVLLLIQKIRHRRESRTTTVT